MIEMRWLECAERDAGAVRISNEGFKGEKWAKLQIRLSIGKNAWGHEEYDDWRDVPVVRAAEIGETLHNESTQ